VAHVIRLHGASCVPLPCFERSSPALFFFFFQGLTGSEKCEEGAYLPVGWCCDLDSQCAGNCIAGFCSAPSGACTSSLDCPFSEYCNGGTCAARTATRQPCTTSAQCNENAGCSASICVEYGSIPDAASCPTGPAGPFSYCQSGWCDPNTKTCATAPTSAFFPIGCNTSVPIACVITGDVNLDPACACSNTAGQSGCAYDRAAELMRLSIAQCKTQFAALATCRQVYPNAPIGFGKHQWCCAELLALSNCMKPHHDNFVAELGAPQACKFPALSTFPATCPTMPMCNAPTTGTTGTTTGTTGTTGTAGTAGIAGTTGSVGSTVFLTSTTSSVLSTGMSRAAGSDTTQSEGALSTGGVIAVVLGLVFGFFVVAIVALVLAKGHKSHSPSVTPDHSRSESEPST
jgi:hypothetical protein